MTSSVIKTMSAAELRALIAPAETMETFEVDPRNNQAAAHFGLVEPMTVGNPKQLRFFHDGQPYQLRPEAYLKLGSLLGVPAEYIKKTPAELMVPHMNHWLEHGSLANLSWAAMDGKVELFSKFEMDKGISNYTLLNIVTELTENQPVEFHHVAHDMFSTSFSVVTEREWDTALMEPGTHQRIPEHLRDIVRTGVTIENSYAMAEPLVISAYVHKLWCTNGAYSVENVYRYARKGGGDGSDDWAFDSLKAAFEAGPNEIARLNEMRQVEFDGHLADRLQSLYTEFGVPVKLRQEITDRVIDEEPQNLLALYDIMTDVGSNNEDVLADPHMSRKFMRIGGRMAAHPEFCEHCNRVMRN